MNLQSAYEFEEPDKITKYLFDVKKYQTRITIKRISNILSLKKYLMFS
jgi:hypothetical protein